MTQTEEKKLLKALETIKDTTIKVAKELGRIADALEPVVLLEAQTANVEEGPLPEIGEVTAEEALAAVKTIRAFCKARTLNECTLSCGIRLWCDYERGLRLPEEWHLVEAQDD